VALLEVRNVAKSFGAIHAVNDISWSVEPGEVVGLMGDNGAGKSTLVKLIAGNFPPTEGEVLVDGEVCHFHKPIQARAKGIEVVYQDLALADNLTAAQNVFLGRELNKGFWPFRVLDKQAMIDRSARLFDELKSETRPRDLVKKMSGGQRQALTLLMATWRRPELLLLDEHTAALDPKSADQIVRLTEQIVSQHRLTTLMVTHSMQQAATLGDRIVMMNQGSVLADYAGAVRRHVRAEDLVRRFDEIRRDEQLDASAAEMLREGYV